MIINDEEGFSPLIIPGAYIAQCKSWKEFKQFGGEKKLALNWDFSLAGLLGINIPQYFNMEHKIFKQTCAYYQAFVIANDCRRPARRTRAYMPPKIFENVIAKVIVVTVKPKFSNGTEKPEVFHYSRVQEILMLIKPNNL